MTCNTCGKPVSAPYRVFDTKGAVIQGCVDSCHTEHLLSCTASLRWALRTEAKEIQRAAKKFRTR